MITNKINIDFSLFLVIILATLFFLVPTNFFLFYVFDYFNGCDMMWSPSSLFIKNLDVFEIYFSESKNILIHCSNYPSYSISNIFFMLPLGYFELNVAKKIWLAINLILLFHIYKIYKYQFYLRPYIYNFIFLFFLISKPTIYTLSIGQYGILALWSFTIIFFFQRNKFLQFFAYFISGLKYTFFPLIFYYSIFKRKFIFIFFFCIINFLFLIIFTYKFNGLLINNLMYPFLVGSQQGGGGGDLMSVLGNYPKPPFNYLLIIIISFIYFQIFYKKTVESNQNHLIFVSLITITIFRHHIYDAVFLLPFLLYLVKSKNFLKFPAIIIVLYFWFIYHSNFLGQNGIFPVVYTKGFRIFNFILLNLLLLYFFLDNLKMNQTFLGVKLKKIKKNFKQYEFK